MKKLFKIIPERKYRGVTELVFDLKKLRYLSSAGLERTDEHTDFKIVFVYDVTVY